MEVLVTTDGGTENNTSVTLWNPGTGTKLLALKGPPATANSLVFLRDEGLLIAEEKKPFIHLWQVGRPLQSSTRIICPVGQQRLGAMAATPDGNFLVVSISEKINVWQPATGRIVQILNSAHYRPVTVLKFTDDGSFLISAGADGIVSVWSFLQLVSSVENKPTFSWAHHTLPVTALHVGTGGRKATLFTASEDRFVKIYSLLTGSLLLSVAFPQPLTAITVDSAERAVFVGGLDGVIYYLNTASPPRAIEHQVTHDGAADGILRKHNSRVTALCVSADGHNLSSGDAEGNIFLWDLASKQSIRTIPSANKGHPITNLSYWLNDPELLKGGRGKKPSIVFPEVPKLLESSMDENGTEDVMNVWTRMEEDDEDGWRDMSNGHGGGSLAEINELKVKLKESREINRKLQEFCVETLFAGDSGEPLKKKAK